MKKTLNNASELPANEQLIATESIEETDVRVGTRPMRHMRKRQAGKRRHARKARHVSATQAPTPAQQQAASFARSAKRRSRLKRAANGLPHYDVRMAWYKSRWPFLIFLFQFALVAIAVADDLPVVEVFNIAVTNMIQGLRGNLDSLVIGLTTLGDVPCMAALCLFVTLILLALRRWSSLIFFIVNVLLAAAFVHVLKLIFAVPRPDVETLVALPSSYSFPSAHSFMSLIVFGLVGLLIFRALYRKGAEEEIAAIPALILLVLALFIGLSRIYVGVHWPSDVLAGWFLGATWLSFANALYIHEPQN